MNLPILIQKLYGKFTFTGLYSFEFVDNNRNTITEIFFMVPPKSKSTSESTRSSTIATLGGNYNVDGGNATKDITLTGELYFPYVGSPDNPVARNNTGLENTLNGMEEFEKIQWMLIRYRDYTMTKDARMDIPISTMNASKELTALYKNIAKRVHDKTGGLYDTVKLIFHDYDMNDHFYCRVDNFSSNQTDTKHIAIEYTISIECYEPDYKQRSTGIQTKKTTNESTDIINSQMQQIDFDSSFDVIQAELGSDIVFINSSQNISIIIDEINVENENIQAGKSTALSLLPTYVSSLLTNTDFSLNKFIDNFLSVSQKALYESGDVTIDDIVNRDLLSFYNSLQRIKLQANSMQGVLNSIIQVEELRYYADSDDYTLSEEQFDNEDSNKVEDTTTFYYYTVMSGDTARIVALRLLNDQEKFIRILQLNNILENDFIDDSLVGEKIKIPFEIGALARGNDNLVYESDFSNTEKFIFGSDIATGINKQLLISEKGDLLVTVGIDNAFNSVENRVLNNKGSLNIFNPNWGTIPIDGSNAPLVVKIDRYLTDVIFQIQNDPRVEAAQMDLDKIEWDGEVISAPTKVFFIGTEETREVNI